MSANTYAQTIEKLAEDPIIIKMASEMQHVHLEEFMYPNGGPTWQFTQAALDTYQQRGGEIPTHIGGPAAAVLKLLLVR